MFVIAGHLTIDPANHDAASAAMATMGEASRAEDGCNAYNFSPDITTKGKFHIFECWDSDDALAAHFGAPHMKTFQGVLKTLGVTGSEMLRYEVSSVGPMGRPKRQDA